MLVAGLSCEETGLAIGLASLTGNLTPPALLSLVDAPSLVLEGSLTPLVLPSLVDVRWLAAVQGFSGSIPSSQRRMLVEESTGLPAVWILGGSLTPPLSLSLLDGW